MLAACERRAGLPLVAAARSCSARCLGTRAGDSPRKTRFVDKVRIRTTGGKGGDGCVSFESEGPGVRRPAGGHGGAGGSVYIVANKYIRSLNFERHHYNAGHGANGGASGRKGRHGADAFLRVPCGTVVREVAPQDGGMWHGWEHLMEDDDQLSDSDGDGHGGGGHVEAEDTDSDDALPAEEALQDAGGDAGGAGGHADSAQQDHHMQAPSDDDEPQQHTGPRLMHHPEGHLPHLQLNDDDSDGGGASGASVASRRPPARAGVGGHRGSAEHDEDEEAALIEADLSEDGAMVLVARGGKPGLGNQIFAGSRRHRAMSPKKLPGAHGETREFELELKTLADVGLVGYPNAGKSTLLGEMSHAKPQTAPYPFTTLHPTVGHLEYSDARQVTVADIPGLIEGAHLNRGLGHEFLRHIERTKALIYVIDVAGTEGRDPCQDLFSLREELFLYDEALPLKPSLIVANKMDEAGAEEQLKRLKEAAAPLEVFPVCAFFGEGLEDVAVHVRELVELAERMPPLPSMLDLRQQ